MYRITRTIFLCKDGSIEDSNEIKEVHDLEAYRASIKGNKYARINFIYSEIDDNGENRKDTQLASAEKSIEDE